MTPYLAPNPSPGLPEEWADFGWPVDCVVAGA
jgi:hypothetical protein